MDEQELKRQEWLETLLALDRMQEALAADKRQAYNAYLAAGGSYESYRIAKDVQQFMKAYMQEGKAA